MALLMFTLKELPPDAAEPDRLARPTSAAGTLSLLSRAAPAPVVSPANARNLLVSMVRPPPVVCQFLDTGSQLPTMSPMLIHVTGAATGLPAGRPARNAP